MKKEIEANRELAKNLGVQGTPAFILNDKFVEGALTYKDIEKAAK